jgi:hypothetical protein
MYGQFDSLKDHKSTLLDSGARWLTELLKEKWGQLVPLERGECLNTLVACGCDAPGIAESIGRSYATVLSHMDFADGYRHLPDDVRKILEEDRSHSPGPGSNTVDQQINRARRQPRFLVTLPNLK